MTQLELDSPFQADARSLLGLVVAVLIGAVATAAGVGGGAIYIPLFNVLVGFALKPSTALSQACITAGSLAAVASNLPRTHPALPDAPLIDLPLMLLLTPLLLVGVGIGVLLNVMLPSWLLNILLLVLLVLLLVQAVAKGRALWAQETKRAQAAAEAAARHDSDAESDTEEAGGGAAAAAAAASGGGIRNALLGSNHSGSDYPGHAAAAAAAAATAVGLLPQQPGLRFRRAVSEVGPRIPRGLAPEQEASLDCLEGLGGDVTAVVSYKPGTGGGGGSHRRRAASTSWDCMEGVDTAAAGGGDDDDDDDDGGGGPETPTDSGPLLPPSVFAAAAAAVARPRSYTVVEEVAAGTAAEGALRSGAGGAASAGLLSPPGPSLKHAFSWRAFNELGALELETDLEGDSEGGGGGGGASGSPVLPPTARLLSQLLRRPLPPHLMMSPSMAALSRSPGAAARRGAPLTRRTSFDQATGAGAAAAPAAEGEEEEGYDSWLQRRSKWRSRFPPGALPHRGRGGASRPSAHLPPHAPRVSSAAAAPLSPSTATATARGQQQQPQPFSSVTSLRRSGSGNGAARTRSRSMRLGDDDKDGDGGGGAGLERPLLGSQDEGSDRVAATIPDPRFEYCDSGGAPPPPPAGADSGGGGSSFGGAVDATYRPPARLETLHEESENRGDSGFKQGEAGSNRSRLPSARAGAMNSAPELHSPFTAAPAAAAAAPSRPPALPASRPARDDWQPARPDASSAQMSGAAAAATEGPTFYLQIEDAPSVEGRRRGGGGGLRGRVGRAAGAVASAAREWAASWAAASRRIPRRFALGLVAAWALYLALQGARAFQPHCSSAWWALLAVQTAAMLAVSIWALLMAATALSRHAEATEIAAAAAAAAAGGDGGGSGRRSGGSTAEGGSGRRGSGGGAEAEGVKVDVPAVAVEVEPAMSGTAALLVLQAPLATMAATFGAGLTGGLLGLGGGMVMGPLLLQIGVHPQVTAASSGAMVLFSSSAALIQFALLHRLNFHYAAVFGAASLVAGLAGTQAVARAVKRSGRPSIVVLALAGVMATGTVCVAAFGLRQAAEQLRSGELGFVGICSSTGGKR